MRKYWILCLVLLCFVFITKAQDSDFKPKVYKNQVGLQVLGESASIGAFWYKKSIAYKANNQIFAKVGLSLPIVVFNTKENGFFPKYKGVCFALENNYALINKIKIYNSVGYNLSSYMMLFFPITNKRNFRDEDGFVTFDPSLHFSNGLRFNIHPKLNLITSLSYIYMLNRIKESLINRQAFVIGTELIYNF
jgi:hypothetical protein